MASAVNRPCNHKNSRGCPKSCGKIEEYINKEQAEFSSVVEIIQELQLVQQTDRNTRRLITDFIAFRHLTAHNHIHDLGYFQMMGAFLLYCRKIVLPHDIGSSKITEALDNVEFARMADINVVVCVNWYLNIRDMQAVRGRVGGTQVTPQTMAKNLNKYVKKSSFSAYKFDGSNGDIEVDHNGNKKEFDGKLLEELAEVLKTSVKYSSEERSAFEELYKRADNLDDIGNTHTELQRVLRDREADCTCPMVDLADGTRRMTLK
jgi:hypothetical protein